MKYGSGLVIGKFYPLHEGHIQLLYFARESCHRLTVIVFTRPQETIPGEERYRWVKELLPDCDVVHLQCAENYPQEPQDHPMAWQIWMSDITRSSKWGYDAVFASEDYGFELAARCGATFVPFDRVRGIVPISGTEIRKDPISAWKHIPVVARPYFVKRIAILGATSSGKSTLSKRLAEVYETVCVQEYGRTYVEEMARAGRRKPTEWFKEDLPIFAQGQTAAENTAAYRANKRLICDTDVLTTCTWWQTHFTEDLPRWMEHEMLTKNYDSTYVLSPLQFEQDGTRTMADWNSRMKFHVQLLRNLDRTQREYEILPAEYNLVDRAHAVCIREVTKEMK